MDREGYRRLQWLNWVARGSKRLGGYDGLQGVL